ncbi:hypothetical protein FRACYDRAFT_245643 [Fragilariopsis cylindrus CCMP1102]|uniref:Uncharacterized protein n=1 Tax=Fragilariopsis cylindrus CCMP1102 TaxID=635003 RepID=A0A1E7F0K7_9STRA|nr:hypothetical protein FRACYDRAFT_245643 [Fragilariopsis cylindrus CCMP1102]|eukprot:OEU11333.1 hypothetical protein FRACYDRAFT_245643 [Fragilariopsis cylindrus CCMP1102]
MTVYARYRLEKSAKEVKIERVVLDKSVRGQGQAVMIMILLCLGYASFYDLVMQALELLSGSFQSRPTLNFVFMAIGFLLLRLSAKFKIWFYSSGIVDSEPFYNQFKETKLFRLKLANSYSATCMRFVAISRQELINSLPSVIQIEGVNPSPIFRSMLTVGLTPLLSQDEIDS